MEAFVKMGQFIGRNWKVLLVLFGLGGTATVLGVIPGTDFAQKPVADQIDSYKGKLVSATDVQ